MFIKLIYTTLVVKALKRNGKYVNIQEVMDQWTLQMGYPVITILGNATAEHRIIITQQHFIYDISTKTKALERQNNRYNTFLFTWEKSCYLYM
jgi:pyroglutamyl-peptidase-2